MHAQTKLYRCLLLLPLAALVIPAGAVDRELVVTRQFDSPVLTIRSSGAEGNKYGFEGGRVVKLNNVYHLFTSEMIGDPHWVRMKLAHWVSHDRTHWERVATLRESTGDFTGKDPRAALWSPMPVFNPKEDRWQLFYVAYQAAPDTDSQWLTNHEGRIWRAVSLQPGIDGIGGPYKDVGIVLQRGKDSDPWEGLQGTDSSFPLWPATPGWPFMAVPVHRPCHLFVASWIGPCARSRRTVESMLKSEPAQRGAQIH